MSIKVVEYLVTKTRYSFLTRILEGGNMMNIKTNIREYILHSDLGSNTKKIENRFYPRFVFLLQIMLVGLQSSHTQFCWGSGGRSDLDSLYFRPEFKDQTNTFHMQVWLFTLQVDHAGPHRILERNGHQESEKSVKCDGYDGDTQHEECDIIDCVGILIVWNVGIQLHAGHPSPSRILLFSSTISLIDKMKPVMRKNKYSIFLCCHNLPDIFPQFFDENNQYLQVG